MPTFYKNNMYIKKDGVNIELKVYYKNDWVYKKFTLRTQDIKYINSYIENGWKILLQ